MLQNLPKHGQISCPSLSPWPRLSQLVAATHILAPAPQPTPPLHVVSGPTVRSVLFLSSCVVLIGAVGVQ